MKQTSNTVTEEESRRLDEERQRKEEAIERKNEERRELTERQKRQAEAGESAQKKLAKKKTNSMLYYYISFGVLGALMLYVIIMLFLNQTPPLNKVPTIDEKRIEEHNQNFPWRQGANKFFEGTSLADAKKLVTSSFASHSNLVRCQSDDTVVPPESFDYRHQWPNCVLPVANQQKTCGSSYAFAISQATSERTCIASKAQKLTQLSAQELLSCDPANQGCKGGYLNLGLDYLRGKGLVDEQCFPYQADSETVKCDRMCQNPTRHRIESYCLLFGEEDIKREIFKNGPVISTSQVYVDFLTYRGGVYQKGDEVARFSGLQAIKIVGWGVESGSEMEPNKGNKYWIVQNSWGDDWGNEGYAKISMGQELMFDQYAYAIKVRTDRVESAGTRQQQTTTNTKKAQPEEEVDRHPEYTDSSKSQENVEQTKLD